MKTFAYAAAAALAFTAAPAMAQDWYAAQVETETGHRVGNPEAEVQLVEFISYTCPHCAHYAHDADAVMQLQYIPTGKVAVEVRPFIRNPVDLAASLLAGCGDADKFFGNHRAILSRQEVWLQKAMDASPAQTARWGSGSLGSRMRAISSDLGFYDIMESRGYSISEADACLSDETAAQSIIGTTQDAADRLGVPGTPSFALNGSLLQGVHTWPAVKASLDKALTPED
ncbi:DsbA family protein [Paraurantiacibacter namhicola]|uniref:DSBA-like thioredoxin domain protein n=1 Tax=Paraurantiacibacter namhicola TaxID=645517 RepID=A0A1C7D7X3_9SPHN|nr:thioredoxin domain-containing protein [Paraurantiacibacter namhicola]ANU07545.1 DSBA-like thioredoxin domain protein [Paraurantiacibacter namhicola]